jgi:hypothetical protein
MFQFPVAVIIDKNQAREALPTTTGVYIESRVCEHNNQDISVYTYDSQLNPVEARIQFKCLNSICEIGETKIEGGDAILETKMPSCVNGFVIATASDYADAKYQISTNEESLVNIIMKKKHEISLDLGNVDTALVRFDGVDYSATIMYPDMKTVELVEDYYNVSVYVYKNSSLTFPAVDDRKCVDIPKEGVAGMFGATEEKCIDINLPATEVEFALVGGGKASEYITEGQLSESNELNINVPLFGTPSSLEELQENYVVVEDEIIYLDFE